MLNSHSFRLQDAGKDCSDNSYIKETAFDTSDGEKFMFVEEDELKEVYEIKECDEYYDEESSRRKEDSLIETYEEELDENFTVLESDEGLIDKSDDATLEEYTFEPETEIEQQQDEPETYQEPTKTHKTIVTRQSSSPASQTQKNIVDPDERYLMSCLPALKRFTPQQKAYVRMGIERLFYEVEFENVSEPKNKRSKLS